MKIKSAILFIAVATLTLSANFFTKVLVDNS